MELKRQLKFYLISTEENDQIRIIYSINIYIISMKTQYFLWILLLASLSQSIQISIYNDTDQIHVTQVDTIQPEFLPNGNPLSCTMPNLFIYNDTSHQKYEIVVEGAQVRSVNGLYLQISYEKQCSSNDTLTRCVVFLRNGCQGYRRNQMNWIVVELMHNYYKSFQYLVNCDPDSFYKPFQWGLFILICVCTVTITGASFYSRAWSYGGFGIDVTKRFFIIFNIIVIVGSILAFILPALTSIMLKIIGSIIGTIGVAVCTSQMLWLTKCNFLYKEKYGTIRTLDIISFIFGLVFIILYWVTDGMWVINDILALSTIVTCIKIIKIRSLKVGVFMLFSLLIIEIIAGLTVHYILKVSYNNLVIQMFQSPLVIVFPSITPEFYRNCAWLPVTNIIFPGLFMSYLRRFDRSRGTFLYLLIGYGTFYIGSILWMVIDMNTKHSLPMAIVSDPIIVIIIFFFSLRRNQLSTIWNGLFYDDEVEQMSQILPSIHSGTNYVAFQQITQDLKIDRYKDRSSLIDVQGSI